MDDRGIIRNVKKITKNIYFYQIREKEGEEGGKRGVGVDDRGIIRNVKKITKNIYFYQIREKEGGGRGGG